MDILRQSSPTRENLSLLRVLEALEDADKVTQRELSRATGLNLKKVNYTLHKLLEKGYVKFQRARKNPDKRTYLYVLTPAGLKAKSQLTYHFLKVTLDFYGEMELKLRRCLDQMGAAGVARVVLYGAGDAARILLGLADGQGPKITGVVDDGYEGQDFHGVPVFKDRELKNLITWEEGRREKKEEVGDVDGILITEDVEKAEARLRQLGVAEKAIWTLS